MRTATWRCRRLASPIWGRAAMTSRLAAKLAQSPVPLAIRTADGAFARTGHGDPVIEVRVQNDRGMSALESLRELDIVEAYVNGDLDFEGDLIAGMEARRVLSDVQ